MAQEKKRLESLALKSAWERYAEFDFNAKVGAKQRVYLSRAAITLAMFAVLLAVFINSYSAVSSIEFTGWWVFNTIGEILRVILVIVLISNFIVFALLMRTRQQESSQELRTAAEEIKKEIYLYRTILQWHEECEVWLSDRITKIQRRVAEGFGTELILKPYQGELPPDYDPADPTSDSGFTRLAPADYLRYRLEKQLEIYTQELAEPQRQRYYLNVGLFVTAGFSMLLAAIPGGQFSAWVAVAIFAAAALMNWLEPRDIDTKINTYNQLIAGLNIIRDWWFSLDKQEQTGEEFFKLVIGTEKVIWSQYNKHASEMWHAIEELKGKKEDALEEVLLLSGSAAFLEQEEEEEIEHMAVVVAETVTTVESQPVEADMPDIIEGVVEAVNGKVETIDKKIIKTETTLTVVDNDDLEDTRGYHSRKRGAPHAFVVMPFGRKQGPDGRWIDFDSIYYDLIKPAVEAAGFESFRADQESVSGDILTDMFQELLLADMVIADLSIDNANVFYELGVRHAVRKRGLVHIQSGRPYLPFDIFNVRTIPYQIDKNGR
ncbi:MAG: SLATT domain-containing protein, partial [Anaerolineae bacterium]|nr:SLATT domain-containing protein [Anaerolineae bacterium]